jgi:hypothetical protein
MPDFRGEFGRTAASTWVNLGVFSFLALPIATRDYFINSIWQFAGSEMGIHGLPLSSLWNYQGTPISRHTLFLGWFNHQQGWLNDPAVTSNDWAW